MKFRKQTTTYARGLDGESHAVSRTVVHRDGRIETVSKRDLVAIPVLKELRAADGVTTEAPPDLANHPPKPVAVQMRSRVRQLQRELGQRADDGYNDDGDANAFGCRCTCDECSGDDNCEECSHSDCSDDACEAEGCPAQTGDRSGRSARLAAPLTLPGPDFGLLEAQELEAKLAEARRRAVSGGVQRWG